MISRVDVEEPPGDAHRRRLPLRTAAGGRLPAPPSVPAGDPGVLDHAELLLADDPGRVRPLRRPRSRSRRRQHRARARHRRSRRHRRCRPRRPGRTAHRHRPHHRRSARSCSAFRSRSSPSSTAHHSPTGSAVAAVEFVSGLGIMLYDINNNSLQAAVTQVSMRSRVSGAYATVNYGIRPIGALLGGLDRRAHRHPRHHRRSPPSAALSPFPGCSSPP